MTAEGMAPKKAVHTLYDILVARGRTDLIPHIAKTFARLAARHQQREGVVLTVAREKDERKAISATKTLLKDLGATRGDIEVHIDETLIGGWRMEGREQLIDNSYKKHLLDLYARATS